MFGKWKSLVVTLLFAFPVLAAPIPPSVAITNLDIPITPGENGIAYPTFVSNADDTLVSVESDCCAAVEIHSHEMKDGVMRMRKVDAVDLYKNKPVFFESGGLHVMLIGLKKPLAPNMAVPITFHFAHAPAEKVTFTTAPARLPASKDSPKHQ